MKECTHQAICCTHPNIGGLIVPEQDCINCEKCNEEVE